jgi:16S rRNA (guanine(527)-N(7))-methyltransferase RsmG
MEASDGLKQLLRESGIAPESARGRQLLSYLALLEKWNARINLTAATEWPALEPLFREGIWASRIYPSGAASHLDIGSGAGFPAILLRILIPRIQLEMVEGRAKKSSFLETVIYALGIHNARVHPERLDDCIRHCKRDKIWDCISWKGVKLNARELLQLRMHAHPRTQFWIFHGRELAVEDPEVIALNFKLLRREKFPGRREWALSTYLPQ